MRIDIITLFPEICRAPLNESMMKRAQESGALDLHIHNLRAWTSDKHHVVDDAPFGGGQGMVMKPEPIFAAVEHLIDKEISIGDYVLTNGGIAAVILVDAVVRLIPGVLGDEQSAYDDSFREGLLEAPQYTRPAELRGWKVPEILLSGNHGEIAAWRKEQAKKRTRENRPDLLRE